VKLNRILIFLSVALLAVGCSNDVNGHASPSTNMTTSTPVSGIDSSVPKVARPLGTARFEKEPCTALKQEQLAQLGIATQPKPDLENRLGPGCEWNAFDEVGFTVVGRFLTVGSSLSNIYKLQEQGEWPYFHPLSDVSGYPGVLLDTHERPKNTCQLVVGVRDDLIYSAQISVNSTAKAYGDPCPLLQKAAEMAVSTMKAGA
jgi:hypothetical protein